jgi:hypothetical protein
MTDSCLTVFDLSNSELAKHFRYNIPRKLTILQTPNQKSSILNLKSKKRDSILFFLNLAFQNNTKKQHQC